MLFSNDSFLRNNNLFPPFHYDGDLEYCQGKRQEVTIERFVVYGYDRAPNSRMVLCLNRLNEMVHMDRVLYYHAMYRVTLQYEMGLLFSLLKIVSLYSRLYFDSRN